VKMEEVAAGEAEIPREPNALIEIERAGIRQHAPPRVERSNTSEARASRWPKKRASAIADRWAGIGWTLEEMLPSVGWLVKWGRVYSITDLLSCRHHNRNGCPTARAAAQAPPVPPRPPFRLHMA